MRPAGVQAVYMHMRRASMYLVSDEREHLAACQPGYDGYVAHCHAWQERWCAETI